MTDLLRPFRAGRPAAGAAPAFWRRLTAALCPDRDTEGPKGRGRPARRHAGAVAWLLGAAFLFGAAPTAGAGTLTFTFTDDGSTVTVAASGSLDMSGFNFVRDTKPEDIVFIEIADTESWAFHPASLNNTPSKRYNGLPNFITTGRSSYTGNTEVDNLSNYSNDFTIRFNTYYKFMVVDSASITGDIYDPTGKNVTFSGTLLNTLGDNDFHIEHAIGDQKIVYTTMEPVTPPATPPATPAGLKAAPDEGAVVLHWNDPSDSTITKYQVRRAAGTSVPANTAWTDIAGSGATTAIHRVTGLTNGTVYTFELRAVNDDGESAAASATATAGSISTPEDFKIEITTGRDANLEYKPLVRLTWARAFGITRAQFKRKTQINSNLWTVYGWANLPKNCIELDEPFWLEAAEWSTTYEYEIRFLRDGVPGPSSVRIRVTTPDKPDPGLELSSNMTPSMPPTNMQVYETGDGIKGSWVSYRVRLTEKPAGNVTVAVTSSDTSVATILTTNEKDSSILTFTPDNWAGSLHLVYVFGVDNDEVTGTRPVKIEHSISATNSPDDYPTTLELPSAHVRVLDDELGVVLSPTEVTVEEGGTATFDVKMAVEIAENATISVTSADPTAATVSPATLTFTSENWDTTQTVTVTGVQDGDGANDTTTVTVASTNMSADVSVTVADDDVLPGAPGNLSAAAGDRQVELTWTAASGVGISKYQVRYAKGSAVPANTAWTDIAGGANATTRTVTGLDNGEGYAFEVRAVNNAGNGAAASTTATPVLPVPNAPTGLGATAGDTEVTLKWTLPTNASEIGKVQVRWKKTADLPFVGTDSWTDLAGTAETYKATGLTNGTGYTFEVRASNSAGDSAAATAAATPVPPKPGAPTGLTATVGNTEVTLAWTAASGTVAGYEYRQKAGSGNYGSWTPIANSASLTSHTVGSLTNGTAYTFEVRAMNVGGPGEASNEATATPDVVPDAPTGLAATAGDTEVSLTWVLPTNVGRIGKVQLRWKKTADLPFVGTDSWTDLAATATTYTVESLTNGTGYTFEVRASNSAGDSTAATAAATPVPPKPGAPTGLTATVGDTEVTLAWTAASGTVAGYEYRQKAGSGSYGSWTPIANSASLTSHTVEGLTNGTAYTFEVRAMNVGGPGEASNAATAIPDVKPDAPTDLTARVGNGQVPLTWVLPTNAGRIDKVQVRWKATASLPFGASDTWTGLAATATTYTATGLENGTGYTFEVRAANSAGDGAAATAAAIPDVKPDAPSLTVEVGDTEVTLVWALPTNVGAIAKMQVRHAAGSSVPSTAMWTDLGASATTHKVTGLTNGAEYAFEVRAANSAGDGATARATAIPDVKPEAPTNLKSGVGDKVVRLTWTAPPGRITGYEIRYVLGFSVPATEPWTPIAGSGANTVEHTVTGLLNKRRYMFQIRAVNTAGEGAASAEVRATLLQPLVWLKLTPDYLWEDDDPSTVTATLSQPSNEETKITISATPAADVTLSANTVLTIPAGEHFSTGTVKIDPENDIDNPDLRRVTISGTVTSTNWVTGPASKTLTIDDDEAPPTVTLVLTPSSISENGGVTTVTAMLDRGSSGAMTIAVEAAPVSPAVEGDFTLSTNTTLTVPAGARASTGTVTITANDNKIDAPDKTVTVSATATSGRVREVLATTLTIVGDDAVRTQARRRVAKAVLAETGRATLAGATDTIGLRFDAPSGGAALTLAGRRVGDGAGLPAAAGNWWDRIDRWNGRPAAGSQRVEGSALLRDSAFILPLSGSDEASKGAGPAWTVWGRGDWRQFEGPSGAHTYDGSLRTGWLGADARLSERYLAGLAVSLSQSGTDYRADDNRGRIETSLTTAWPYLQMTTKNGGKLQLVLGVGGGEAEHRPDEGATERADMTMLAGSVGGRFPAARWGRFTVTALGNASLARVWTDGSSPRSVIEGLTATSWRLRGGLEAEHDGLAPFSGSNWRLRPRGVLAVRQDGGDGVAGIGLEVAGGVRLSAPGTRFGLDMSGHWLAAHSENGAREWGASLEAWLKPRADGRGLSLALGPEWGAQQQTGALARTGVLARERLFGGERRTAPQSLSLTARAGYGFAAAGGLLTPFAETALGGGSYARHYRTGIGFARNGIGTALTAGHRAGGSPDTRIELDLRLNY